MKKLLYAIGHEDTEKALTEEIQNDFEVVGTVIYKEALIGHIEQSRPDIVILRERLPGSLSVLDLTYTIRTQMPDIRIIFIAEEKLPGDSLLSALVGFGIYDILASDKIRLSEIIDCLKKPRTLGEAAPFQSPFSSANYNKAQKSTPKIVTPEKKKGLGLFGGRKGKAADVQKNSAYNDAKEKERLRQIQEKERQLKEKEAEVERIREAQLAEIEKLKEVELAKIRKEAEEKRGKEKLAAEGMQSSFSSSRDKATSPVSSTSSPAPEPKPPAQVLKAEVSRLVGSDHPCQVVAFMGAKHGVGNTTVALNTAGVLAAKYKVLFIEVNERYPATSYLFEFRNMITGLEVAAQSVRIGEPGKIDAMIEHAEKKKCPPNLHFLPFSHSVLIAEKENRNEVLDVDGLNGILSYLLEKNYYDYIFVDIQPDDRYVGEGLLDGRLVSDSVFFTITQDVHSIACADYKKHQMEEKFPSLLKDLNYVVNSYEPDCKMLIPQIANVLDVAESVVVPISLDYARLIDSSLEGEIYAKDKYGEAFLRIVEKVMPASE